MTTAVQPDIELALVNFLRSYAPLTSLSVTVGTELPKNPSWPFIVVTRLGGPVRYPGWVANPRLLIDCWADTKSKARSAADTAVAALFDLPGVRSGAVITDAAVDAAPQWLPDSTVTPARPRYQFSALLTSHP